MMSLVGVIIYVHMIRNSNSKLKTINLVSELGSIRSGYIPKIQVA
jgi:hypothetical protein